MVGNLRTTTVLAVVGKMLVLLALVAGAAVPAVPPVAVAAPPRMVPANSSPQEPRRPLRSAGRAAGKAARSLLLPLPLRVVSVVRKPLRDLNFWGRAMRIYGSYKGQQLVLRRKQYDRQPASELFNTTHEINSRRMLDLCLSMRGFYLKTGQFLATRHDFMPLQYTTKLSRLHDDVPPMPAREVRRILERELKGPLDKFFSSIELDFPLGSASVAQVHKGVWRASGQTVAVKVQYPTAERMMRGDLRNLRVLAEFLQRTELKFDLLSAIKELQRQIGNEFDFQREASNMEMVGERLRKLVPEVRVPRRVFATRRVLVMSFLEGDNLRKLAEYKGSEVSAAGGLLSQVMRQRAGKKLLDVLAKSWGNMIFKIRAFNADPHPGNICISRTQALGQHGAVGLLDWGQVKLVSDTLAADFSNLVLAIKSRNEDSIVDAFFKLGVCVADPSDRHTVSKIALSMLDTQKVPGFIIDPFDPRNSLKTNSVTKMPAEMYFLVRTVQLMRGICFAFGLDYSLADQWAPLAKETLKALKSAGTL